MLETIRAFGVYRLPAAGENRPPRPTARRVGQSSSPPRSIPHQRTDHEPDADAALRGSCPTCAPPGTWRALTSPGSSRRLGDRPVDCDLRGATSRRPGCGPSSSRMTRRSPVTHARPRCWAARPTPPTCGDYVRAEELANLGLNRPPMPRAWPCLSALALTELSRGAYAAALEACTRRGGLALSRARTSNRCPRADLCRRTLQGRGQHDHMSPQRCHRPCGRSPIRQGQDREPRGAPGSCRGTLHRAIDLARSSGAAFLVAIAAVGLLSVRVNAGPCLRRCTATAT